jgi:CAAX protease family protein
MTANTATPTPPRPADEMPTSGRAETNDSRLTALAEAALIAALLLGLHPLLRLLGASVAIGASATIFTLATCTWLLRRHGGGWRDLGLVRPIPWRRTIFWTIGLFVAAMLLPGLLARPLADSLGFAAQRFDAFADLRGNLGLYLLLLIPVGWGAAAFGEELIYRGFVFARLTQALGGSRLAGACALLLQASLFALGHTYLGPRGMLNAGLLGLLSGGVYVVNGRMLWPLIFAHAAVDSMGLTALYLGVSHGQALP